jgi:L-lactate dehydrogenase
MKPIGKIAIIGVGQVGGAAANAMILAPVATEILLVDCDISRRDAQVQDLTDVAYSRKGGTRVRAASYTEAAQCDIVIITAGSKHFVGQPRLDYTSRNISIIQNIMKAMVPFNKNTILIVVSNPVDLLTSIVQKMSGVPKGQVLGSGTFLDSIRVRGMVAKELKVAANSIDLYVLGVHGESQVTLWSQAKLGGIPFDKVMLAKNLDYDKIAGECRDQAQLVMQQKGSRPFGIGSVVAGTCTSILMDKRNIRPLSHFQPEYGCCFSLPALIGRQGVIGTMHMPLNEKEEAMISVSAKDLRKHLDNISEDFEWL